MTGSARCWTRPWHGNNLCIAIATNGVIHIELEEIFAISEDNNILKWFQQMLALGRLE